MIVTRSLSLPLPSDFVLHPRCDRFVLSRRQPIPASIPAKVEVELFDGEGDPTVDWMVSCLVRRGIQTLLIEAGGELLFQFCSGGSTGRSLCDAVPAVDRRTQHPVAGWADEAFH